MTVASTSSPSLPRHRVLTVMGTRPEVIKLAPVVRELQLRTDEFETISVASGQHTDLFAPFVKLFEMRIDHQLQVMEAGQPLNLLAARLLAALDPLMEQIQPEVVLAQGDTTTALAAALAAFQRGIPVGHIGAGLRTDLPNQPFPEEMNRRLISRLAT